MAAICLPSFLPVSNSADVRAKQTDTLLYWKHCPASTALNYQRPLIYVLNLTRTYGFKVIENA